MSHVVDLTGMDFRYLHVIGRDTSKKGDTAHWICRCKCGTVRTVKGVNLRNGMSTGCGCARAEKMRRALKQKSSSGDAARAKRGICYNVFCPQRDNYKGAWSCRRCHGCAGRGLERVSKREVLEI